MEQKKYSKKKKLKYSCEELLTMEAVEVYKLLLNGKICRFPMGFWERPEAEENAINCSRFLFEEILRWDIEDIKEKLRMKTFPEYKLAGMMQKVYKNSPYSCVNSVYPNKIKPWELTEAPSSIWQTKENRVNAIRYLIEEKLKWSREDICEKFSFYTLKENSLSGMLDAADVLGSPFKALDEAYPNEFRRWEIKNCSMPSNYWKSEENRREALKWLFEEKLKYNIEDIPSKMSKEDFYKYGLSTLFAKYYKGIPYEAINELYPNRYKQWEFAQVENGFWDNKDNVKKAVRWLVFDKLKLSKEEAIRTVSSKDFSDNNLGGLSGLYGNSVLELMRIGLDLNIKPWEIRKVSNGFWDNKDKRIEALNWLVKEKLKITNTNDIENLLTMDTLRKYGLGGLVSGNVYKNLSELKKDYSKSLSRNELQL